MPIALALASSLVWGTADFLGGLFTRRAPVSAVTVVSQTAGLVALLVWFAVRGVDAGVGSFAFGLAAGVGGAIGLPAFYKALAVGTMSIVSPVTACGAVVPFALALARGERPSAWAVSARSWRSSAPCSRRPPRAAPPATVGVARCSQSSPRSRSGCSRTSSLSAGSTAIPSARSSVRASARSPCSSPARSCSARRSRRVAIYFPPSPRSACSTPRRTALFVFASRGGYLSAFSVLGSLYPVVTLIGAHLVLSERITRVQRGGVALALVGVCVIAGSS